MTFGQYLKDLRKQTSISQRELAEKSGISNAEISRIETGDRQKPAPDALKAIAPVLGVQYEELLEKAGYLSNHSYINEVKESETTFIDIITPKLIKEGWGVELANQKHGLGDLFAKKGNEEWLLEFKYFRIKETKESYFRDNMIVKDVMWKIYGRLVTFESDSLSKFSFVVNIPNAFDTLCKYTPRLLNIKVSIILIDLENHSIVAEKHLPFPFHQ